MYTNYNKAFLIRQKVKKLMPSDEQGLTVNTL